MADTEFLMPPFQAPSSENKTPPFSFGIPTEKQKPVSTEENITLTVSPAQKEPSLSEETSPSEEPVLAVGDSPVSADTLGIAMPDNTPEILLTPNIGVIGVGGAGGNAVNNMIETHLTGARFIVANTDAQAMTKSLTPERIQLGCVLTQGLGAGSRPDIGEKAALESEDKIRESLENLHMLFIAAGMGGGTGTGASPVIARIAKEMGILTVAVITKPFRFEGPRKMRIAEDGIEKLSEYVDTMVVVPSQNLFRIAKANTSFLEAFKIADTILCQSVRTITDLMMTPMHVNVDFADLKAVIMNMGRAIMGCGEAEGDNRALVAAEKAITNPLLDVSMKGAQGILINISASHDLSLMEVDEAAERIRQEVDEDANIIMGASFDDQLGEKIRVSVVATGIDSSNANNILETRPLKNETITETIRPKIPETQTVSLPVIPRPVPEEEIPENPLSSEIKKTESVIEPEEEPKQEEESVPSSVATFERALEDRPFVETSDIFIPDEPMAVDEEIIHDEEESFVEEQPVSTAKPEHKIKTDAPPLPLFEEEPSPLYQEGGSVIDEELFKIPTFLRRQKPIDDEN